MMEINYINDSSSSLSTSKTILNTECDNSSSGGGDESSVEQQNSTDGASLAVSTSPLKKMTEMTPMMGDNGDVTPPQLVLLTSEDTASDIVVVDDGSGGMTPRQLSSPQLIHTNSSGMPSRLSGGIAGAERHLHRYRHYVEAKLHSGHVRDDPLAATLIHFPDDNVTIQNTSQTHRTREATGLATDASEITTDHIKMSLDAFREPRRSVVKTHSRYKKEAERLTHFDNDKYDIDIDKALTPLMDLDADEILSNLLKEHNETTDQENATARKKGRVGYFRYFRPDYNWGSGTEVSICNRVSHEIWSKQPSTNILIELKGLVFMLGELEPFFCSLYLYDSANKTRLSENFYFDFNSDQLKSLIEKHSEPSDITTQAKHVIVSIPNRQMNDIWIIVRINKIMQGDPDVIKDPYVKLEEKDVKSIKKNKAKVSDVVAKFCDRLGKYTQGFCVAAIPLTSDSGEIKSGVVESDALFKQIPKDNDDINEMIADLKDPSRRRKIKTIPGTLSLNIVRGGLPQHTTRLDPSLDQVTTNEPLNPNKFNMSVTPSINAPTINTPNTSTSSTTPMLLVNAVSAPNLAMSLATPSTFLHQTPTIVTSESLTPTSILMSSVNNLAPPSSSSSLASSTLNQSVSNLSRSSTVASIVPVIREIQCFPLRDDLIPHSDYINNLYIYPDTVNLSKASGRNICIKVELRDSDIVSHQSLKAIYGKSSCQKLTNHFFTETHYHTKSPNFIDEIKIKLPTQLTPKYHILFTYYHIVCNKKKEKEESESLIGYSVLPLYKDRKFVDNGQLNFPVALGAPKDNYLKAQDHDYSFLENGKNLFKLNLRLNSSIYPQNSHLNKFFLYSQDPNLSDNDLNQILNDFTFIDAHESIKFLPVIIRQLIYVMCNRDATVGCNAIKAIFILLSKIQVYLDDSNVRIPLLVSFIAHVFDNPKDTKIPVYSALCSRFVYFLMVKKYQKNQGSTTPSPSTSSGMASMSGHSHTGSNGSSGGGNGLNQSNSQVEISNSTLFSFSWFIFDLIIKSLTLSSLGSPEQLKGSRENRYDHDFIKYIPKLVSFIIHHFQGAVVSQTDGRLALEANNSLALFVRDLFPVFDRGIAIDLVFSYIQEMNQGIATMTNEGHVTTMTFFKFDFLKILTDYEHYININIPLTYTVNNIQTLTQKILDMFPIAGVLLTEVFSVIESPASEVRSVAMNTLVTILIKHEYDSRYQAREKRERIAAIYLPIILWFLESFGRFTSWYQMSGTEEKRLLVSCVLFVMKNLAKPLLKNWLTREVPQRLNTLFSMIDYCTNAFEYHPTTRNMPMAMSMGMGHPAMVGSPTAMHPPPPPSISVGSGSNSSPSNSTSSLPPVPSMSILPDGIPLTKFLKKQRDKGGDHGGKGGSLNIPSTQHDSPNSHLTSMSTTNMASLMGSKSGLGLSKEISRDSSPTGGSPNSISPPTPHNARRESVSANAPPPIITSSSSMLGSDINPRQITRSPSITRTRPLSSNEPTLCAEANLIALDFIEDFIELCGSQLEDASSPVIERLFTLLIDLLGKRQSHRVIASLLSTLRSFVHKFRHQFFKVNNNFCGMLCQRILNLCNSPTTAVRTNATAFFYTLLCHNSQEVGNIGRVKIQSTIALSKLASDYSFGKNGARFLECSLASLVQYSSNASVDQIVGKGEIDAMDEQVREESIIRFTQNIELMATKLGKIIRDTMRVNQLKENSDPETIHELYSKIASGYSDTPIIRVDWLDALASLHVGQENYIEAAICKIRIAMLVYAYLDQHNLLPCKLDTTLVNRIVPELVEVVVEEDEGVCTSPIFSINGLLTTIQLAINQFRMGECFEFAILLYKLVIPLCEKTREYDKLSDYYKHSHKLYKEIIKSNESKSRMLGRYYRVGFYGRKFEDLNGKEFVYKEPKLTHLFGLAERLKTFYREKLGEPVNIFPDSGRVDTSSLDQDKLYLQITSLKPYFDQPKLGDDIRIGYFDRKTLLNKFVFITPFTLTGKPQGSITEQFHRKSIITIDCTAPNMLKRYPIIKYKEIEISPIENSIETIEQRSKLLALEVSTDPVNIKTLQGVLQGSVLLQVNAGALEICRGFLAKNSRATWNAQHIQKLEVKCREFLGLCERALALNKSNIQMNQIGFHHELEMGYKRLQFKMDKYICGELDASEEAELDQAMIDDVDDDSALTITEESYDEPTSSIKETISSSTSIHNVLDNLTPNFIKEQKKKNGFLTVREKPKRESRELNSSSTIDNPISHSTSTSSNLSKIFDTPRKRDSKGLVD